MAQFFCASSARAYNHHKEFYVDHEYLNHRYYIIEYLDIEVRTMSTMTHQLQLQATTSMSGIHDTPTMDAGGWRGENGKAPEGDRVTSMSSKDHE
jgi:hypothetical protein